MHEAAEIAYNYLNNCTIYSKQKNNIKLFFDDNIIQYDSYTNRLEVRLTLIDSLYSTNMNRRLYGIEDIANKMATIAEDDDNILKGKFVRYFEQEEQSISDLFEDRYGIRRTGEETEMKAKSLISKFAYFITNYNSPIYDKLVNDYILEIIEKDPEDEVAVRAENGGRRISNAQLRNEFFNTIKIINAGSQINAFDKLDNLCWLYGKIINESYSLILGKVQYQGLMSYVNNYNINHINYDGDNLNNVLVDLLHNNEECLHDLLGDNLGLLTKFMRYVLIE